MSPQFTKTNVCVCVFVCVCARVCVCICIWMYICFTSIFIQEFSSLALITFKYWEKPTCVSFHSNHRLLFCILMTAVLCLPDLSAVTLLRRRLCEVARSTNLMSSRVIFCTHSLKVTVVISSVCSRVMITVDISLLHVWTLFSLFVFVYIIDLHCSQSCTAFLYDYH